MAWKQWWGEWKKDDVKKKAWINHGFKKEISCSIDAETLGYGKAIGIKALSCAAIKWTTGLLGVQWRKAAFVFCFFF